MEKGTIIKIGIVLVAIISCIIVVLTYNKKTDDGMLKGKHYVEITVKNYGKIKLELDADKAPITVTNFIKLVKDKFYDGLTFHRIIDGFMIQGGGYTKDGSRKVADKIKGEFSRNGIENDISHKRGVISMGRTSTDYNSASSQFFIVHKDYPSLDGNYAAFGHVISGMEVVDKIVSDSNPIDNNGSININERPIIESIRVVKK